MTVAAVDPHDIALADKLSSLIARKVRLVQTPARSSTPYRPALRPTGVGAVDLFLREFRTPTSTPPVRRAFAASASAPPSRSRAGQRPRGQHPGPHAAPPVRPAPPGRPPDSTRRNPWEARHVHLRRRGRPARADAAAGRDDGGHRRAEAGLARAEQLPADAALRRPPRRVPHRPLPRRPAGAPPRPGRRLVRPARPPGRSPAQEAPAARRQGGGRRLQQQGGHRRRAAPDRLRPDAVRAPARRVAAHLLLARLRGRLAGRRRRSPRGWSSRSSG